MPGIGPGLLPPQGSVLPLYYTPKLIGSSQSANLKKQKTKTIKVKYIDWIAWGSGLPRRSANRLAPRNDNAD